MWFEMRFWVQSPCGVKQGQVEAVFSGGSMKGVVRHGNRKYGSIGNNWLGRSLAYL